MADDYEEVIPDETLPELPPEEESDEVQAARMFLLKQAQQLEALRFTGTPAPYAPVEPLGPSPEALPPVGREPPQAGGMPVAVQASPQISVPDLGIENVQLRPEPPAQDIQVDPETGLPRFTVRPMQGGAGAGSTPEGNAAAPVPLPPARPQNAQVPPPMAPPKIEPFEFLTSRSGNAVNVSGANPVFAQRLTQAIQEAEAASGGRANVRDMQRDPARQAQYYANYTRKPVAWDGKVYQPQGPGGLAAPPGRSRHQVGNAADIARGPVLSWMHKNQGYLKQKYGLEFLTGNAFRRDPVHIQLARGVSGNGPVAQAGAGTPQARTAGAPPSAAVILASLARPRVPDQSRVTHTELPEMTVTPEQEGPLTTEMETEVPIELPVPEQAQPSVPMQSGGSEAADALPPEGDEPKRGMGEMLAEPFRQFGQGVLNVPGGLMYGGGAAISAIPQLMGFDSSGVTQWFLERLKDSQKTVAGITGASQTPNLGEKLYNIAGGSVFPAGRLTAPLAAIATGVHGGLEVANQAVAPAMAEAKNTAERKAEFEGWLKTKQDEGITFPTVKAARSAMAEERRATAAAKAAAKAAQAEQFIQQRAEHQSVVVETISGPAAVDKADFKTLGYLGIATLGALFVPSGIRFVNGTWSRFHPPQARTLKESTAPVDTVAISNNMDVYRTSYNAWKGATKTLERAGTPLAALKAVEDVFSFQTRGAEQKLINEGILTGKFESTSHKYNSRVSIESMRPYGEQPDVRKYLYMRHMHDELLVREAMPSANQGIVPVFNGQTSSDLRAGMHAMEQVNPMLRDIAKNAQEILRAERAFQLKGSTGTISKSDFHKLTQQRPNTLPYSDKVGPLEQNPFVALGNSLNKTASIRMLNDAKAAYMDALEQAAGGGLKPGQKYAMPVTQEELRQNPSWEQNTVTVKYGGVAHKRATDPTIAFIMNHDPYFFSGGSGNLLYKLKRVFEANTTGPYAPWFAEKALLRGWHEAQAKTPAGFKAPGFIGSHVAVARQLVPQTYPGLERVARGVETMLDDFTGGRIRAQIGNNAMHGLSNRIAKAYNDSLWAQTQQHGGMKAPFSYTSPGPKAFEVPPAMQQSIDKMVQTTGLGHFGRGYLAVLDAMRSGPQFNFILKNKGKVNLGELTKMANELQGNPMTSGMFYGGPGQAIRAEGTNAIGLLAAKGIGFAAEKGRVYAPWTNIIQQSVRRHGEMYMKDPVRFTAKVWQYTGLPAAATTLAAAAMGNDPNGVSYLDYQNNRRDITTQLNNIYFPIPGLPAERGYELPVVQELAIVHMSVQKAMYHLIANANTKERREAAGLAFEGLTAGPVFTEAEDRARSASAFAEMHYSTPAFPAENLVLGMQGKTGKFGMFGESYVPKSEPFTDVVSLGKTMEQVARNIAPAISDIVGTGWSAAANSDNLEEGNYVGAAGDVAKGVAKRIANRTSLGKVLLGDQPMRGNNPINQELMKKEKALTALANYERKSDEIVAYGTDEVSAKGVPYFKPKQGLSKSGLEQRDQLLGRPGPDGVWDANRMPDALAGHTLPEPTNPKYLAFIGELNEKFKADALFDERGMQVKGGIGYKSLLNDFRVATQHIQSMRNVQDSNAVSWARDMKPEQKEYLIQNKVDPENRAAVQTHYEKRRTDAAKVLLYAIRAVEQDMSKRWGAPVKFEDIHPYVDEQSPIGYGAGVTGAY